MEQIKNHQEHRGGFHDARNHIQCIRVRKHEFSGFVIN